MTDRSAPAAAVVVSRLDAVFRERIETAVASGARDRINELLDEKLALKRRLDGLVGHALLQEAQRAYNALIAR